MASDVTAYPPIDFLTIGHICQDVVSGGHVIGGAAAYTAAVASALGCRSAVVTSAAADADWSVELPGIAIHNSTALQSTCFENIYTSAGRIQTIHAVADKLSAKLIPPLWARAPIVYLGPIANEVDPEMIGLFSNSIVGVGPQGWMRRWDDKGHVFQVDWESAADVLPLAAVTFLSTEDVADRSLIAAYARRTRLLVVTDGANGCSVYHQNDIHTFPAPVVPVVDTTGAGDIFAAAYLVRFYQTDGDYLESAKFANRIASHSVSFRSLPEKAEAIHRLSRASVRRPAAGQWGEA